MTVDDLQLNCFRYVQIRQEIIRVVIAVCCCGPVNLLVIAATGLVELEVSADRDRDSVDTQNGCVGDRCFHACIAVAIMFDVVECKSAVDRDSDRIVCVYDAIIECGSGSCKERCITDIERDDISIGQCSQVCVAGDNIHLSHGEGGIADGGNHIPRADVE